MCSLGRHLSGQAPLGRLIRLPLRLVPGSAVIPILSGPLRGLRWITGSSRASCWLGRYEAANQRFIRDCLRPGDLFVDVGANVGFFSLLGARCVGKQGSVVAFEPFPPNAAALREHLRINRLENVQVVEAALLDQEGRARFTGFTSGSCAHLDGAGELEVGTETLDGALARLELGPPRLIKLDVEGAEARVLAGARRCLTARPRPLLLIATHGTAAHESARAVLRELGYPETEEHLDLESGDGCLRSVREE